MPTFLSSKISQISFGLLLTVLFGFLILKSSLFGILLLVLVIFIVCLFLNFKVGLVLVIFTLLLGQLTRFSLSSGGSIVLNDFLIPLVFFVWLLIKLRKKEIQFTKPP